VNAIKTESAIVSTLKKYNVLLLLIGFIILASIISDSFFSLSNFLNLLQSYGPAGIIAIGMTFSILVAGIDLSVGSVAALSGMVSASLLAAGQPAIVCVLGGVGVGCLTGTLTGVIITFFKLEPFIVSLATMVAARGMAMLTTDGKVISGLVALPAGKAFGFLGGGSFIADDFKIPFVGVTWIAVTVVFAYILKYTNFGRGLYAIGGNKEAAALSGIRVRLYTTLAYTISGVLAAYAGIMLTSWLTVAQPTLSEGAELDAIAAAVIGGTAMQGGKGGVWGTLAGVFILAIITNLFNLMGLPSYYQQIFKGIIIVAALIVNNVLSKNQRA
jgi:ribose transport system permease protein